MKLEMQGICKAFGTNRVLKSVDFHLDGGEICALLGENGAGKSTLMNILGGVLPADEGTIALDGTPQVFANPTQSLNAGIAFIHQELNLINDLPIYENMFIGRELKKPSGFLDHARMIAETRAVFDRMGLTIDPRAMVSDLDASYKQIVEISRALLMKARLIIMDEPTTSLTDPEIERVFAMLRTLREQEVGIVFISHKLREVMAICDRYAVLRDGVMVAQGRVADTNVNELARFMVGHDVRTGTAARACTRGEERLKLTNLTLEPSFRGVNLTAYAGEVLGVTGLLGDGRSELFRTVFGAEPGYEGEIRVMGKPVKMRSTRQAVALGIGYVPRNRKENGIVKDMNILENGSIVTWPQLTRHGFLNHRRQRAQFDAQRKALSIKLDRTEDLITSLSGGNQQKVVLAKWLSANPSVLILDNPTQGVDVGAKEEIYDIIKTLADHGVAVIVLSSEAQEMIRVCDRALVMYHGAVRDEVSGERMTEHEMMRLATGA
ncbi:MAG TPA: sugar ABC transporter ATP-binding protein [Candidatus Limiplasma sp.]|nr:sugar ABC transporter ATP-binding protein [Candidatus Limiplasma sp.]HPS80326.1 sugar ABC transporter ATP-binding protein [Candidatus Limiplasma sp.]